MKKIINSPWTYALLAFAIIIIFTLFPGITGNVIAGSGDYDALAQCLTSKGAIMYGTAWCSHCQDQKELFGSSFRYITFVDCDKDANACSAAGVEAYPTWIINGKSYQGQRSLIELASIAGCNLKAKN